MKHPKFKGTGALESELDRLESNLRSREIALEWAISRLKESNPDFQDIAELRKKLRGCEKSVIKAKRQIKTKKAQIERKATERNRKQIGGKVQKMKRVALDKAMNEEIKIQDNILAKLKNTPISFPKVGSEKPKTIDLFISHASEDKAEFVKPLADELIKLGINVWYDEYSLRIGDSLRRSIDSGLSQSRFGLIVLSTNFFEKNWTQYELNGLVAKEMEGEKVILPIWHNITKDQILKFSPTLVDKVALNSAILSIQEISEKVADAVKNA